MKNSLWTAICLFFVFSLVSFAESRNQAESVVKCATPKVSTAFQNSAAVFSGEVLRIEKSGDEKIIEFRVKTRWKGVKGNRIKIRVYETPRYQAWFETGKSYLVFARKDDDGNFRDDRCSRTKLLSNASKDIKELGRAKSPR